ncbi:MAG TPA: pyridoxal-phosphate dependent enzyme [Vicinamibacterales bacterium]|jgi:cysteine synthase B|nr:pyridoxal-phosphate dependent enzyme [Vicinamibacterales bacterium]
MPPLIEESRQVETPSLPELVGHTPLVRLPRFEPKPGVAIYAKLEMQNPGGSVKDRAALAMMLAGERSGAFGHGRILLDATSGNTGIAYAMIGAARGHRVRLCVPSNVTPERKRLLQVYGADLVLTDPMEGSDGAIRQARAIYQRDPQRYFYPDQYSNDANWQAHFHSTGVEILEQTAGRITHFVAGLGTSGTFVGTGRRLRQDLPDVKLVSVQPDSPLHGLEGLKHMESAIVPAIYDPKLADIDLRISTDIAHTLVRRLAREEGLFVGPSSGAALAAAIDLASDLKSGIIVAIFPDGGDRYLSDPLWDHPGTSEAPARAEGENEPVRLHLPEAALASIRRHGARVYPNECCGALLGTAPGHVTEAFSLDNTFAEEQRRRRFLVGPEEYRRAEARATETGLQLIGFYHSHPDHPAEPSQFDLDHAWPNLSYIIFSVRQGQPKELRSWRLKADRSAFEEEFVS